MSQSERPQTFDDVFHAKRGRTIYLAGFFMLFGLVVPLEQLVLFRLNVIHPLSATGFIIITIPGLVLIAVALILLIGIGRGLPSVSIGPNGIIYKTAFRTMSAKWSSLAPFKISAKSTALFSKRAATSFLTGPEVSKNIRKARQFQIPEEFDGGLESFVAKINDKRASALAGFSPNLINQHDGNDTEIDDWTQVDDPSIRMRWVTVGILAALTAVYSAEYVFSLRNGGNGTLSSRDLLTLGGLNRDAILDDHEWYRIFTSFLLHANFTHLVSNGIALLLAGFGLEKLLGRIWFFAFFIIGGVGGALFSLALDAGNVVSVGASGAVMALFSASLVMSFRLPRGSSRRHVQIATLRILLPALFPSRSNGALSIDVAAHAGGTLAGLIAAVLLLKLWSWKTVSPPGKTIAKSIASAGLAAIVVSIGFVLSNRHGLCTSREEPEKGIKACSDIIQANKADKKGLAHALATRSMLYTLRRQNDLALLDVNRAVELDSGASTLTAQGVVLKSLHRYYAAIEALSAAISLKKNNRSLPTILAMRAGAYSSIANNREAEADLSRALKIDPSNSLSMSTLPEIYMRLGKFPSAIASLNQSIQKSPSQSDLYWLRGIAGIFQGTPASAIVDLTTAVKLDPTNGYKVLWLHIAHAKAGQDDHLELQGNSLKVASDTWPWPLIALYLNKSSVENIIATAKSGDSTAQRDQTCEANFYIGELDLEKKAGPVAEPFLHYAVDNCPVEFIEYTAAEIDLMNLGH